jgi:hypothetical protein
MSVFISHTTKDDPVAERIREALESLGIDAWIDSRELTGGDPLPLEVRNAIKERVHFIVVLSAAANNSQWVEKEFNYARKLKKKMIPVMLPGIGPGDLRRWFGKKAEPIGIPLADSPGAVSNALPALLAALGEKLPAETIAAVQAKLAPVADLILELTDPAIETTDGKRRATATAKLIYKPEGGSPAESEQFQFTAPLDPSKPKTYPGVWSAISTSPAAYSNNAPNKSRQIFRFGAACCTTHSRPKRSRVGERIRASGP